MNSETRGFILNLQAHNTLCIDVSGSELLKISQKLKLRTNKKIYKQHHPTAVDWRFTIRRLLLSRPSSTTTVVCILSICRSRSLSDMAVTNAKLWHS